MSLTLLATMVCAVLALGYHLYGRRVARALGVDAQLQTPAVTQSDGVDFVPTKPFYLLGQHFSAIAAAGPIAGPIIAAQQFGWLPAVLWIGIGVVFIGAVHDVATLFASVRHGARSIAEVVKEHLGTRAGVALMVFIWVALVYVVVAFADVTASTFTTSGNTLEGAVVDFHPGGAVAMASVLYLVLSVAMGLVERFVRPPLWLQTVVFVPATLVMVWLGTKLSTHLVFSHLTWAVLIFVYCFIASLTPVWALLQPRGYLGGFVLYLALAVGVLGIFFGGYEIEQPMFRGFSTPGATGLLFPFLFVTIACGACSGFHGLVCSGTTSKQLASEKDAHLVGYGAMLLEGFVAVIALATVMMATPGELAGKGPGVIYGAGIGRFVTAIFGEKHLLLATTFGAMAFSTFVFDTLDVSTRLGRYILQELFGWKGKVGAIVATALTCLVPAFFVWLAGQGAYLSFWTLFGTSNQLLAAMSLLGLSVWFKRSGKRYAYVLWPMLFVSAVTVTSLVMLVLQGLHPLATIAERLNAGVSFLLLGLACTLLVIGLRALVRDSGSGSAASGIAAGA